LDEYYTKLYLPLVEAAGGRGEVVAQQYAGTHKDMMARYHSLRQGVPKPSASEMSTLAMRAMTPSPDLVGKSKEADELLEAIKKNETLAYLGRVVGGDTVPLDNPEGYHRLIWPHVSKVLKAEQALDLVKEEKRDIVQLGGTFWTKQPNQKRLDEWLLTNVRPGGVMKGQVNQATKLAITVSADKVGIDGTPNVVQIGDVGGVPTLALWGRGADKKPRVTYVSGEEVHSIWDTRQPLTLPTTGLPLARAAAIAISAQAKKPAPVERGVSGKITQ
jgi:hypothetical protein